MMGDLHLNDGNLHFLVVFWVHLEPGVLHGILVLVLISTSYAVVGVCLIQLLGS